MIHLKMEEHQVGQFQKHEFNISFHFQNRLYLARASMVQMADHDEYHILPEKSELSKEYGSQTVDLYYGESNSFRFRNPDKEYMRAIAKGVEEYLNARQ